MTKLNFTTKTAIALYAILAVVLSSCTEQRRDNTNRTESGIRFVGKYEVSESGMKYILYREVDGGLFIINTTKDSLETELARKRLSEK